MPLASDKACNNFNLEVGESIAFESVMSEHIAVKTKSANVLIEVVIPPSRDPLELALSLSSCCLPGLATGLLRQ